MVLRTSNNMVGKVAPDFEQYKQGKVNLIMFICNHCPYVTFRMEVIARLVDEYPNVNIVAINSNDPEITPEDAPELMDSFKEKYGLTCEYIYDHDHVIADSYDAACTPEFFVTNKQGNIMYHGELDHSRPSNDYMPDASSLRLALDCAISDIPYPYIPAPAFGCAIKRVAADA